MTLQIGRALHCIKISKFLCRGTKELFTIIHYEYMNALDHKALLKNL